MQHKEKSLFSHFFKGDAETVQEILNGNIDGQLEDKFGFEHQKKLPRITASGEVTADEFKAQWRRLRSFFRNGNNAQGLPGDIWPVGISPFFTGTMVGADFPLWVAGENFDGEGPFCLSLKEIITQSLHEIWPSEKEALILKNNVERILHLTNDQLADKKPHWFREVIGQVLTRLEEQLDLTAGEEARSFSNDLKRLQEVLPETGVLLPFSIRTTFQVLEAAMEATLGPARKNLEMETGALISKLRDLLSIEREKGPEGNNPDKLRDAMGFMDSMMKFDKLAAILPHAGSEEMGEERVRRITAALKDLEEAGTILHGHGFLLVDQLLYEDERLNWDTLFGKAEVQVSPPGKASEALGAVFERHMTDFARFFAAKRIAELELADNYQADIHDEYFEHFTWQYFSTEELNSCPYFILIADDIQLLDTEFSKLSAMLSDNLPIKIVAVKRAVGHAGSALHAPAELGALMLSFRNIYVAQSTSLTPKRLFHGFREGLTAFAPAFFHVLHPGESERESPFVRISAAIEGRDFPGFTFRGLLGTPWGSRFEVENNPQPELPWPVHVLNIIDEKGTQKEAGFPFTFADQALLDPAYHQYYFPVPAALWSDDLIPLTDYMAGSAVDNIGKVPFIWMMDAELELHKIAVSWPIVLAAQERLDFWRFLQENSGINNYHVARAVEQAKMDMQEQHDREMEQLVAIHQLELKKIRETEAEKVMENLAAVLLDLDIADVRTASAPVSGRVPAVRPPVTTPQEAPVEATPAKSEEDKEVEWSTEPYIDTALCTSCNECINLNGALFKYNSDKMAYIADPAAGTFSELVQAAEKCPVGIIHPGSPLNPNEPDLDNLIKRAEKFN